MLAVVFGFGFFTWIGFLYVAVRVRTRPWALAAGCYIVAAAALFLVSGLEGAESESPVGSLLIILAWLGGIVHALIVRSSWLRWRAFNDPWRLAGQAPTPPHIRFPGPVGSPPIAPPQPRGPLSPAAPSETQPLRINSATHDELAVLSWFDANRIIKVILERERRGRFYSVEEFAAAGELTPYQLDIFRRLITL